MNENEGARVVCFRCSHIRIWLEKRETASKSISFMNIYCLDYWKIVDTYIILLLSLSCRFNLCKVCQIVLRTIFKELFRSWHFERVTLFFFFGSMKITKCLNQCRLFRREYFSSNFQLSRSRVWSFEDFTHLRLSSIVNVSKCKTLYRTCWSSKTLVLHIIRHYLEYIRNGARTTITFESFGVLREISFPFQFSSDR